MEQSKAKIAYMQLKDMDPNNYDPKFVVDIASNLDNTEIHNLYALFKIYLIELEENLDKQTDNTFNAAFGCDLCMGDFYDADIGASCLGYGQETQRINSIVDIVKRHDIRTAADYQANDEQQDINIS